MTPHWSQTEWADGLDHYGHRLRRGDTTVRATVEHALARIARHDDRYQAFVHVAADTALQTAQDIDACLTQGQDLGPLMGVPIAVKDLFAVRGMPTKAGSRMDVAHAIGPEGPVVARLKAAGAIILGKTRTIEFAAGAHNISHPTPWNPADPSHHRSPGGSSNGSAVAVAAGFCPLAIGSDTGGSVRVPAALCGIAGYKASVGALSCDGVFALCPQMDSVGVLAVSAHDAMRAGAVLLHQEPQHGSLVGRRLGVPHGDMLDGLTQQIATEYARVLQRLGDAGAHLVPLDWPRTDEITTVGEIFAGVVPRDLIATLGPDRLALAQDLIDPVARHRLAVGAGVSASDYTALEAQRAVLNDRAVHRMQDLDGVVSPTSPICAPRVDRVQTIDTAVAFTGRVLSLTRLANVYGLTACTIPLRRAGGGLPVGLDIAGPSGADLDTLALAAAIAEVLQGG
ncbi:amidase [Roseobacter sp.]|uniref:amidase n=1 Tax=Roseobacter sp. TaxID=1907202 RepID=UPI00329A1C89